MEPGKKINSARNSDKRRKGSIEALKYTHGIRKKLSPRSWNRNSNSSTNLSKIGKKSPRIQIYKSNNLCCWELENLTHAEVFEKHWQDGEYDVILPLPSRLKFAIRRYLYYHDVYNSQLFELYDTGSRIYLMRWAGPHPDNEHFKVLWNEFISEFEPRKYKRIYVHPDEEIMADFLESLRYAEKIESGNDYKYTKWYIHNPDEYSSGELSSCKRLG